MIITRRAWCQILLGAGAGEVGVNVGSYGQVPTFTNRLLPSLEAFNAQFGGYERGERHGAFSVFFTGLKPCQHSSDLVGQWLAWPRRTGVDRYFVSTVPCAYVGEYFVGQVFPRACCSSESFVTPEGRAWIEREIAMARIALLAYLVGAGMIGGRPSNGCTALARIGGV